MIAAPPAVAPDDAYYASRPVLVRTAGPTRIDIVLRHPAIHRRTYLVRRPSEIVRSFNRRESRVVVRWNGLLGGGRGVAPDGRYAVRVNQGDSPLDSRRIGTFDWHDHRYPIAGPHADRGGIGYFGAPRNGGRIHEGFDVNAACGTPLVAARGGRVLSSRFDPVLYGNLVIIHGRRTHTNYWYAHLQSTPRVAKGDVVRTGQPLGEVGATGNAASVGCHLHFEVHERGVPVDPEPLLHAWDAWS